MDKKDDKSVTVQAVFECEHGELFPAELTIHAPEEASQEDGGHSTVGYSRRYSDGWEQTFGGGKGRN